MVISRQPDSPVSHPLDDRPVPTTYTRILLQGQPRQARALLAGTGLDAGAVALSATFTVAQQLTVFRNAMCLATRAGRGDWAIAFGRQLSISSHGPLGFAALSAPTLGEGLDVLAAFARIRAPYLSFATVRVGARFQFEVDTSSYPLGELEQPMLDIVFQIARSYVDAVLGTQVTQATLLLRRPGGRGARRYRERVGLACEFGAPVNAFSIPAGLYALPCPLHDESSYRAALVKCRETLDGLLAIDDVRTRAGNWLAARFDQMAAGDAALSAPRLEDLAAALALSPCTLTRRLAAQGAHFRALRDAGQHAAACRLLGDARYTVAEIGHRLGYGDAANFGRAFRRLAGVAPGQFRRRGNA